MMDKFIKRVYHPFRWISFSFILKSQVIIYHVYVGREFVENLQPAITGLLL
jgi:hypothetical protein